MSFVYLLQCLLPPSPSLSTRLLIQRWDRSKLISVRIGTVKAACPARMYVFRSISAVVFFVSLCLCSILIMLSLHISAPEHSASPCFYPQALVWFVAFKSLMPHVDHNVESSQSMSQPPLFPPLPLGFVTLTTGRGSAGAECRALSLTVIINNLEPQKWAMRLLDTLSGLERSDVLLISVAWIYPLVCISSPFSKQWLGCHVSGLKFIEGTQSSQS